MSFGREEYEQAQAQLLLIAGIVRTMPLSEMLNAIEHAHAVAPILDPTLYRDGVENIEAVAALVRAALPLQRAVNRLAREART